MTVGSFGDDIVFQVSDDKVFTVDNFSRDSKANFAEHKVINNPAILEFLGRELETIKFTVPLHKGLGIDDLIMEAHKLRQKLWDGTAEFFILNNHAYTQNKMVITDLSEQVEYFDGTGAHIAVKLDVTMKEYREQV